ncbi:hypothetical protein BCD91_004402 [Clostridium beijerinckii]|uniref:hypothetical protein n=1 Tax=Clostridium beijerinckii TaxID=1520 RepID=UPI001493E48F|nr:hypothetical protein [Clostridium beijerinckii]NOW92379.1 hypothetical protein [Clostridium beijerinckii]
MKNNVLIIYSDNSLNYAEALQHNLKDIAYITLEQQLPSAPMQNKLKILTNQLESFDYGIAIISENFINNKDIVFLIGLLIGHLGLGRFALLVPNSKKGTILSNYLLGFEPNYYDDKHPSIESAIGQAIYNIKEQLCIIKERKNEKYYNILNNKKELLSIAIKSCGKTKNRYHIFLQQFIKCFNAEYNSYELQPLAATIFASKNNYLCQIGAGGLIDQDEDYRLSLDQDDENIVKCYKNQKNILLTENFGRFDEGEDLYEYIFCKLINKKYVLTVHIQCDRKIEAKFYDEYLKILLKNNAGYIAVLDSFLKGGEYCCQNQR